MSVMPISSSESAAGRSRPGCSLLISLVLAVGIVWLALRSRYVPYVVVTDRLGQAITIPKPLTPASMPVVAARMERWEIEAFIRDARSVSSDPAVESARRAQRASRGDWKMTNDDPKEAAGSRRSTHTRAAQPTASSTTATYLQVGHCPRLLDFAKHNRLAYGVLHGHRRHYRSYRSALE